MKYNYEALLAERPEHKGMVKNIEYVQNPWRSDTPLIAVNKDDKSAKDSEYFEFADISYN